MASDVPVLESLEIPKTCSDFGYPHLSEEKNEHRLVLSPSRTGSQALVSALSEGGTRRVGHMHFLGRRALLERSKSCDDRPLSPMIQQAIETRSMIGIEGIQLQAAVCIRDPIARQISHMFKFPEIPMAVSGVDVHRDPRSAEAWMVEFFHRRRPLTWFDEHVSEPFGVEFFDTPFDLANGSLRLVRKGLRLVVIRHEDCARTRQAALGWLLHRESIPIPVVDRTEELPHGDMYRKFRAEFRPPRALLDEVYNSRMMRHFYSDDERQRMRDGWT